jgi:NADH:ubiquinone oxidoreductase subunit 3 (subunit A)
MIAWRVHFKELDWWKFLIAAILVTMPLSITFHALFGVNTKLNYELGLSNKPKSY